MSKAGGKRALGADDEEKLPWTDEQLASLDEPHKVFQRLELAADRYRHKLLSAEYEKRDKILNALPDFWQTALKHSITFLQLAAIEEDTKALQFLTKVKAWRDPEQPQAFGFEFHFGPNPFFANTVLKKEFKYVAPSDPEALKKDANGVSQADLDFDFERDTDVVPTKIDWKEDTKNLTKLHPQIVNPEDPEDIEEHGSFFHIFESPKVSPEMYEAEIVNIYENAIDFFFNRAEGSLGENLADSDDEDDDEDDDSDAEDIDLENPKKKAKK